MEVGTYHFTWGPEYDMDAYMTTLFGGEAWGLVSRVGSSKNDRPNPTSNTSPTNIFTQTNQDLPKRQLIVCLSFLEA
jgi:hypothetical protein